MIYVTFLIWNMCMIFNYTAKNKNIIKPECRYQNKRYIPLICSDNLNYASVS